MTWSIGVVGVLVFATLLLYSSRFVALDGFETIGLIIRSGTSMFTSSLFPLWGLKTCLKGKTCGAQKTCTVPATRSSPIC